MKPYYRKLVASLAAAALASALVGPAFAAPQKIGNRVLHGVADATANQTFATTSYADLAAASVSVTPLVDYAATEAPGTPSKTDWLVVYFTANMSKATATTGTCALYANGAIVTKTAQTVTTASLNPNVTATWYIANATTGAQTVKIQCKSGDTNTLTVANAHLAVEEIR